jgi:hypothetical protein
MIDFLLLGPQLAGAGKGMPGAGRHIPYPPPQDTLSHVQVMRHLHHCHAALGHQLHRLELELSAELSSMYGNLP